MYDLNELSSQYTYILEKHIKYLHQGNHILLYQKLFDFRISHLAPAYHLNSFNNAKNEYFEKDLPELLKKGVIDDNDLALTSLKVQLELNALLIAIKTSLDKLVYFISRINKSVSPKTTFGRIKENQKASGLMSEVLKKKNESEIMNLLYENYLNWISDAVEPRDTIVHYENLNLDFKLLNSEKFEPVFSKFEKGIHKLEQKDLQNFVDNWLKLSSEFIGVFCRSLN